MKKFIYIFVVILSAPSIYAADTIHYFDLKNRPADEVIPLIRPLLNDTEAMSGDGYQLFIKAPTNRLEEIESLISSVDRASKTFRISVTSDEYAASNENNVNASVQIESNGAKVNAGKYPRKEPGVTVNIDTRNTENKSDKTQFVQVQEGKPAYISKENLRITPIYSYVQRPNGNFLIEHNRLSPSKQDGFYVVARSADNRSANISIQSASNSSRTYQGYGQEQTYVDTTLRVRLGEWFEIGGNTDSRSSESNGILYRTKKNQDRYNKIFLKIELSN
ncbi:MAG: hypothetical protein R8G33_02125 [Gammaproteobacteria bacterium]|nr:hypothetical protein [Gammaproteobacteria bacterium]